MMFGRSKLCKTIIHHMSLAIKPFIIIFEVQNFRHDYAEGTSSTIRRPYTLNKTCSYPRQPALQSIKACYGLYYFKRYNHLERLPTPISSLGSSHIKKEKQNAWALKNLVVDWCSSAEDAGTVIE
ncbi:hypothetical protein OTU49_002891 [Cherax quadricarinatus]|uniref:Uncharacterized protein n=1 Tax=Cherax quadricarinatus TaxID=27406 RepID=A0AAW0XBF5_CHEQU